MKIKRTSIMVITAIILSVFAAILIACAQNSEPVTEPNKKEEFTVVYEVNDLQGGYISGNTRQSVERGKATSPVTAIAYDGYVFIDWSDGRKGAKRYDTNIVKDKSVFAQFEVDTNYDKPNPPPVKPIEPDTPVKTFTVAYCTEIGGVIVGVSTQKVRAGESTTQVQAVPDDGFDFIGWSDDVADAVRVDLNIESDFSVTARFVKKKVSLTYYTVDGGSIEGEAKQRLDWDGNGTTVTAVNKDGYKFLGWSDGVETEMRTDSHIKEDVEYIALFEKRTFKVTYNISRNMMYHNDAKIIGEAEQIVEYGGSASMVVATYDGSEYQFDSWSDGVTTPQRVDSDITEDLNVTAIFRVAEHSINYQAVNGRPIIISRNNPENWIVEVEPLEGYELICWSDGVTTTVRHDNVIGKDKYTTTVIAYCGKAVDVKVAGNNGGKIFGETHQVLLADEFSPVCAQADEGYVFAGWSNGSNQNSLILDTVDVPEYYAYFEPIEKTFTYDYGVATGMPLPEKIVLTRSGYRSAMFAVPQADGYEFAGWYADKDYSVKVATQSGKYMLGLQGFGLETDKLYARFDKTDEQKSIVCKILNVGLCDVVDNRLSVADRAMIFEFPRVIKNYMQTVFAGMDISVEVDTYYMDTPITADDISQNRIVADTVAELKDLSAQYDSVLALYNSSSSLVPTSFDGKFCFYERRIIDFDDIVYYLYHNNGDAEFAVMHRLLVRIIITLQTTFDPALPYTISDVVSASTSNTYNKELMIAYLRGEAEVDGNPAGITKEYWEQKRR